jgi:hypothetical protein
MKKFSLILAGAVFCVCFSNWQSRADTNNVSATVQLSDDQSITVTDFSNQIGVQPGQVVGITIQFTADKAGEPVVVEAIDGGVTSVGSSLPVLNDDGSLSFTFIARGDPGQNRVGIRIGSTSVCLQLWVIDSANPQNNPSSMIAVSNG